MVVMMKVPAEIRTYCPRCNSHTIHKVSIYKKGKDSGLRWGVIKHEEEKKGYGGQKWPEQKRKAKTTKKVVLKLSCKECGYISMKNGIRIKKIDITSK
jgi:large subunit ribosomal protein L44e